MNPPATTSTMLASANTRNSTNLHVVGPNMRLPPCQSYCSEVMFRCFGKANLDMMDLSWKKFVNSFVDLASKLSSKYNIATVIDPLDTKVSDAIMNFQDNGLNITAKVFNVCGKPNPQTTRSNRVFQPNIQKLTSDANFNNALKPKFDPNDQQPELKNPASIRSKRELPNSKNYAFSGVQMRSLSKNPMPGSPRSKPYSGSQIDTSTAFLNAAIMNDPQSDSQPPDTQAIVKQLPILINDIRKYMNSLRGFWTNLPLAVCSSKTSTGVPLSIQPQLLSEAIQTTPTNRKHQPNCYHETIPIYSDNVDIRYTEDIRRQVNRLASMTANINRSLGGEDIDWSGEQPSPLSNQAQFSILPPLTNSQFEQQPPAMQPLDDSLEDLDEEMDQEIGSGRNDDTEPSDDVDNIEDDPTPESNDDEDVTDLPTNNIDNVTQDLFISPQAPNSLKPPDSQANDRSTLILVPAGLLVLFLLSLILLFLSFVVRFHIAPHLFCFNRDKKDCTKSSVVLP